MTRSRAVERRQERETEKRRQQRTTLVIGIIVTVVVIGILVFLVRQPADAPIPEESEARYAGLSQSRTEEGYARLGDPDATVVKLYSSFSSADSKAFHDHAIDPLVERVRSGAIQLIFVPLSQGETANGLGAARTAVCTIEQSKFWQVHDTLFDWQGKYGNQSFNNNRIVTGLGTIGIDEGRYNACLNSGVPGDVLNAAEQEATALPIPQIPAVAINGVIPVDDENVPITSVDGILAAIDEAIATAEQPAAPTPNAAASDEVTATATTEATAEPTEAPTETSAPPTAAPTEEAEATATP